jgi:hypothetical protein
VVVPELDKVCQVASEGFGFGVGVPMDRTGGLIGSVPRTSCPWGVGWEEWPVQVQLMPSVGWSERTPLHTPP